MRLAALTLSLPLSCRCLCCCRFSFGRSTPPSILPLSRKFVLWGGLSFTFLNQSRPLHFTGHQFIYNASLVLMMTSSDASVQYRITASLHSRSNLLLVDVTSATPQRDSFLSLTTYTVGPFETRSGSGSDADCIVDYITRDSFYPNNSFPITAAVVTRVMALGQDVTLVNRSSSANLTVTSTVRFTSSLSVAALVWTNLDEAGLDQGAYEPPPPVPWHAFDPLASALSASRSLNDSSVAVAWQETAAHWSQFWQSTCVVRLPSQPSLERYYLRRAVHSEGVHCVGASATGAVGRVGGQ